MQRLRCKEGKVLLTFIDSEHQHHDSEFEPSEQEYTVY